MHRNVNITWETDKNKLSYAKAKAIEWVNAETVDLAAIREIINRLSDFSYWGFSTSLDHMATGASYWASSLANPAMSAR